MCWTVLEHDESIKESEGPAVAQGKDPDPLESGNDIFIPKGNPSHTLFDCLAVSRLNQSTKHILKKNLILSSLRKLRFHLEVVGHYFSRSFNDLSLNPNL